MDRDDWIIGVHSSGADGINMYRFYGTVEETKAKLLELVNEDKGNDSENWEHGTETVADVQKFCHYQLYGYGQYADYHVDYTAVKFAHIDHLENMER